MIGLRKHEMHCHAVRVRRQTTIRHTAAALLCALSAGLLGACSAPTAPEAGNVIETAPASTRSATVAAVDTTIAEIVASSSVSPSTVPMFVPPSTTLPDDPDLREAIRVRIAVEAEYRRQARAGIADPAGFVGLADPDTWLVHALADLKTRVRDQVATEKQSVSGVVVYSATRPKPGQILLDVCVFDDDIERSTQATAEETDDVVTGGLDIGRRTSVMVLKGGSWLYQGSVVSDLSC